MIDTTQRKFFHENGYLILKKYIQLSSLEEFKKGILVMVKKCLKTSKNISLNEAFLKLEKKSHRDVYVVQKAIATCFQSLKIVASLKLDQIHSKLYSVDPVKVHTQLLQTPVHFPRDDRFDHEWHQESGAYVGFSNMLSVWFPILYDHNEKNGSVSFIPKSHKNGTRKTHYYIKPSGLNDFYVKINKKELSNSEIAELKPGDVLMFSEDLIHKSLINKSNKIRLTGILRSLDMCSQKSLNVIADQINIEHTKHRYQTKLGK